MRGVRATTAALGVAALVAVSSLPATAASTIWLRRYSPPNGNAVGTAVALSPDGSTAYAAGSKYPPGIVGFDALTVIAYDRTTGARLWKTSVPKSDPADVLVSPDGSQVFVTGFHGVSAEAEGETLALGATDGAVLWERRFPGTGTQGAAFGAVATDGSTVYVAGSSDTNRRLQDYTTVAYDAATGVQQWRRLYDGGAHNGDGAAAIVVNGGRVFVTGSSLGVGTSLDYATIAYGATDGHRLWVERFDDQRQGTDEAFAIVAAPDGSDVFVTGNAAGHDETIAYDARDGTERWARDLRRRIGHRSGFATEAIAPTGRRC